MPNLEGFTFTSSQKRGTFFLICLLLVGILTTVGLKFTDEEELADQFESDQILAPPVFQKDTLIRLDINLANSSQLAELNGIGPVLSKRIINYRNSLGGFSDVKDIANVYGLSPETFESIKPHLYVNTYAAPRRQQRGQRVAEMRENPSIDINLATARELEQLPGIGKTLSNRIIKYRNIIGGFDNIEQLKQVYYLEPDVFEKISPMIFVNPASRLPKGLAEASETRTTSTEESTSGAANLEITDLLASADRGGTTEYRPITRGVDETVDTVKTTASSEKSVKLARIVDLNQVDSSMLVAITGIDPATAKRIVKFRRLLGFYVDVEQLKYVYGISSAKLNEIRPFLKIENTERFPRKDLNRTKARNLSYYPFINKNLAESLIEKRREFGRFDTWREVASVNGMTDEILAQLQIYFEL